jgi:hypothetical protein
METSKPGSSGGDPFAEAFGELLPVMLAIPDKQVIAVNLSIPTAVAWGLAVEPRLLGSKDEVRDALCAKEPDLPEKLARYAYALVHADALYRMTSRANDPVPSLAAEGMKLRRMLLTNAKALVQRGFVDEETLRNYNGSTGFRSLAFDLFMLAQLFRERPASVRALSAAGDAELLRANEIGVSILRGLRRRTMPDPAVQAAGDVRNRAFTLLTRGYDRLRRAAVDLRWNEGDADELVPSLYTKRGRPKKTTEVTPPPDHPSRGAVLSKGSNWPTFA